MSISIENSKLSVGIEQVTLGQGREPTGTGDTTRSEKKVREPLNFVAPEFERYRSLTPFGISRNIIEHDQESEVFSRIEQSGLGGCGGAGFPVSLKWKAALGNLGPRVLIVNGQEGELDTFKDYMLMKHFPRAVVEGAALAAFVLKAEEVVFAINSAYSDCIESIQSALDELLIEIPFLKLTKWSVVSGPKPDLYVVGEETALIEFLEGRRCEPQIKPPFPFQSGLHGLPTVVQNVETLAWIPLLMSNKHLFSGQSILRLVHVFGAVCAPGIYEIEIGHSLEELLKVAGGLKVGSTLQAIEVGGVAGGFIPASLIDVPFDRTTMADLGAMVGTGSIRFMDQYMSLTEAATDAMSFFRSESCGRCTPCRVGTQQLETLSSHLHHSGLSKSQTEWLFSVSKTMTNTSTCGLGKGAPSLLVSLFRYWNMENGQPVIKPECVSSGPRFSPLD